MVEPRTFNPFVVGSSPTGPTREGGASASPSLFLKSIPFNFRNSTARSGKRAANSGIFVGDPLSALPGLPHPHFLAYRTAIPFHTLPSFAAFALPDVQLPLGYQTLGSSAGSRSGRFWRLRVRVRFGDFAFGSVLETRPLPVRRTGMFFT